MCFREQSFESGVHGREPAIVSDLENGFGVFCFFEDSFSLGDGRRERFLAEDMFAGVDSGDGERDVSRVRRSDEHCVRMFDHFVRRCRDESVVRSREPFGAFRNDVVYGNNFNAFVAREKVRVNAGDVTGAYDSDSDVHVIRSAAAFASRASSNGSLSQYSGRKISTLATPS